MPTNRAAWIREPKSYPLEVGPATFPTTKSGEVIIKAQTYALVRRQPQTQSNGRSKNKTSLSRPTRSSSALTLQVMLKMLAKVSLMFKRANVSWGNQPLCPTVQGTTTKLIMIQILHWLGSKQPSIWWFSALRYSVYFISLSNSAQSELQRGIYSSPCCNYGSSKPIPPLSPRLTTSKPKPSTQWQGHFGLGRIIFSGSTAIQLSVASGLEVISTASKLNHNLVKSVGATTVLDYKSPTIVQDVMSMLSGRELVGIFDAISEPESMRPVSEILDQVGSHKVGLVVPPTIKLSKNFIPTLYKASHEHMR
ncbi:hypothetical protein FOYG_13003 [Fusarium oxysporum NRRL 32931]|uniref:Alcohol dehydrogenase-like C-terminal domain-containing protein n=1 Tax=Fusarium oxysporum NRRL 32931 TaxID=660029 RepID=W9HLI6_FUSOX|nr:hypothetical protein FOYG_13003 [Fusarium oxysporum NRRL 32931]